jgi:glycerate kinase
MAGPAPWLHCVASCPLRRGASWSQRDAAEVFAGQKGATPEQVAALTSRLRRVADALHLEFGADVWDTPRAGAGGGLGGALFAAGATLVDGAALVAHEVGLAGHLDLADLVITGEGRFDATSVEGKAPGLVLEECRARGLPVVLVAGEVEAAGLEDVCAAALVDWVGPQLALAQPEESLHETTRQLLLRFAAQAAGARLEHPATEGIS